MTEPMTFLARQPHPLWILVLLAILLALAALLIAGDTLPLSVVRI